ncbi:MAG TPA: hypothetical protein GXX31_06370 [Methanothermobacter sp.]|jgi:hypothetical protein|uniref:Uncharacterized protein n=1 Tax=Methanothermobacter tenebrarum TaxID=680118 RepID=A0ABN6PCY2_9EURY|nr:hypothetical protein [Methanothermobacter tenebrarum]MDD3454278.1 hypothetical protein [Methanobacteriales archaeon]MDI6881923.1 hypothetical protein [Methanothermobacter sp.]MDX9692727.1 hypothetical protein [Methanothermobacter sp.]BDH79075.1 hypothetical protein MTTB_04540 [Methanothermobacter tenebrarum]HHW16972.1 hypothetical protein [Methanothermobacter sp.]
MSRDPIEEYLKDPDRRAKIFLILTWGMILTRILIVIGLIIFILVLLGIIRAPL